MVGESRISTESTLVLAATVLRLQLNNGGSGTMKSWPTCLNPQVFGFPSPSLSDLTHASDDPTPANTNHGVTQQDGEGESVATRRQTLGATESPSATQSDALGTRVGPGYSRAVVAPECVTGGHR